MEKFIFGVRLLYRKKETYLGKERLVPFHLRCFDFVGCVRVRWFCLLCVAPFWLALLMLTGCPNKSRVETRGGVGGRSEKKGASSGSSNEPQRTGIITDGEEQRYVIPHPAQKYNGAERSDGLLEHGEVVKRVYEMVKRESRAQRKSMPGIDQRLARMAADFARLPKAAHTADRVLAFLNSSRGLLEPVPLILVISASDGTGKVSIELLGKRLSSVLGPRTFTGMGAAFLEVKRGVHRLVLALQESFIDTEPIPRKMDCGEIFGFTAWVKGRFKKPSLVVTLPDGNTHHEVLSFGQRGSLAVKLDLDKGPGRYQVEILADGRAGPTVLANFPVYCGVDPPTSVQFPKPKQTNERTVSENTDVKKLENWLIKKTNEERRKVGIKPLKRVEVLVKLARMHSSEMCNTGRFGHISPVTGSATDRLREAGYKPRIVGENVAQAGNKEAAHSALMGSPSHRANILSPKLTHIGIGVVICKVGDGSTQLFVTQKFMTP